MNASYNHKQDRPPIILIVEDHDLLRSSIVDLLHVHFPASNIHKAQNGEEAVSCALALYPDVMVLDFTFQGMDSIKLVEFMSEKRPETAVIIMSDYDNPLYMEASSTAGARAYLLKNNLPSVLIPAISRMLSHSEKTI